MAKKEISDIVLENLKGFVKKGAASTSPGNIPTGHFELDFVMHHGELPGNVDLSQDQSYDPAKALGIPMGKLVMFYGEEGGGKCVTGDTFIVERNKGQIKISDLFSEFGKLKKDTWYKLNEPIEVCVNGEYEKVESVYYNGNKKTTKVKTSCGYELEGSYDRHRILCVCDGDISWKKLKDIEEGDFVCISRKSQFPLQSSIDKSIASVLGYMIAEGYCGKKRSNMMFTNFDPSVMKDFISNYQEAFGQKPLTHADDKTAISVSVDIGKKMGSLGLERVLSGEKTIPHSILSGNYDTVTTFLRSYFEGDGGVAENGIECSSKSYELMQNVQLLLLRLGIVCSVHRKTSKLSYTNKYPDGYVSWRLSIKGSDILKYAEHIGFVSPIKKMNLNRLLKKIISTKRNANKDIIPKCLVEKIFSHLRNKIKGLPSTGKRGKYFSRKDYQNWDTGLLAIRPSYLDSVKNGVSKDTVEMCSKSIAIAAEEDVLSLINEEFSWLKEDYFFDVVEKVEISESELYDISVDNAHAYWTNGFISHNSSLAYRVVGYAQKMGLPVAWLDTEHSFADNLAELNGVDRDTLYYSNMTNPDEPDKIYYAEDVFDAIIELIKSGVKVIVLDSVANLVTKDRMEANAEQVIIGKLARLMSENLGKIVAYADKFGATVIAINQLRVKIGQTYGSPDTTPGGKSLKHNSSVILKISKINSKESNIEIVGADGKIKIIGRKTRVNIEKNRLAKPFFESLVIPIYYEPYFPDFEEIAFDVARQLKIITVYNGTFKWKKENAATKEVVEHKAENKSSFIDLIKYNEFQLELVAEIVVKSKESDTILPPEITKWIADHPIMKEVDNTPETQAEQVEDDGTKTKKTVGRGKRKGSQSGQTDTNE